MAKAQAPGIKARMANGLRPKGRVWSLNDQETLSSVDDIIEETKKLYPALNNEQVALKFRKYIDALFLSHGPDNFILKDKSNLDSLFTGFARIKNVIVDEAAQKASFETQSGGHVVVERGSVVFEPAMEKTGRFKKPTPKKFTMDDAYDLVLVAMRDSTMLPPNRMRINNATPEQRAMIQIAALHVQKVFLPKGMEFDIVRPSNKAYLGAYALTHGIKDNFDSVMFRADARKKDEARTVEKAGAAPIVNPNEADKSEALKTKAAKSELPKKYQSAYENLSEEEKIYVTAKNLLLNNRDDYLGASTSILAKDLQTKFPKLKPVDINKIVTRLTKDSIIEVGGTNKVKEITKIAERPQTYDKDYSKVAASMIHQPALWFAKDGSPAKGIEDVAKFLYGSKKEYTPAQIAKVEKIWENLQKDKIVALNAEEKISKTATEFAGTDVGTAFIRTAKGPVTLHRLIAMTQRQIDAAGVKTAPIKKLGENFKRFADKIADEATIGAQRIVVRSAVWGPFPKSDLNNWQNSPAAHPDFNKIAKSMIKKPEHWIAPDGTGKQRKDVADFLFGKHKDLAPHETRHLIQMWSQLKDREVLTTDSKGKITGITTAFDGRTLGGDFIKAAKAKTPIDWKKLAKNGAAGTVHMAGRIIPFLQIEDTPAARLS